MSVGKVSTSTSIEHLGPGGTGLAWEDERQLYPLDFEAKKHYLPLNGDSSNGLSCADAEPEGRGCVASIRAPRQSMLLPLLQKLRTGSGNAFDAQVRYQCRFVWLLIFFAGIVRHLIVPYSRANRGFTRD